MTSHLDPNRETRDVPETAYCGRSGRPRLPGGVRFWSVVVLVASLLIATGVPAASSQRGFASPQDAVDALLAAVQGRDAAALIAVLGPARDAILTGDRVADRAVAERFAARYRAKHAIVVDGDRATLTVGEDDYPFAFPLVRSGAVWRFDTEAGKEELLARRIGENELSAMQVLLAIADAQRDYASQDRNGNGIREYATRIDSTPGKRDGLFWRTKDGEAQSPLGPLLARASAEGYTREKQGPTPYHGYYFRLLKGQAASAKGGALDYTIRGRTIGGFAAVAYPAQYGRTGIMSFIVNQDGTIYQKDLGPESAAAGRKMQRFDPGAGWSPVAQRK
jgi:hypothetical protein